ncbi:MAG: lactonase family protein [Pirellulales bacterium]
MIRTCLLLAFCTLAFGVVLGHSSARAADECLVYIGTYSGEKSQGIYVAELDLATGKLSQPKLAAEVKNASFLAVHPSKKFLYAVSEISDLDGKRTGGVSGFAVEPDSGKLTLLNQQSSEGAGPCHLIVDKSGRTVLVANYGGGSVAALPIDGEGKLSPAATAIQHQGSSVNKARQEGPHAHSINVDPANRFAVAADLGLDKVLVYRLDPATSKLTPNLPPSASVAPGSGPRHFAFHPNAKFAYVINEILCTVTAFQYDPELGLLTEVQTITTLPNGESVKPEYSTAEVQVHPSGKFLYGSNRGHDSITVFAIDPKTGKLTFVENESTQGKTPRGFGIDPTGNYLLAGNQGSDTFVVFRIDPKTGQLDPTGQKFELGAPVCFKFLER